MSTTSRRRRTPRRALALLSAGAVVASLAGAVPAASADEQSGSGIQKLSSVSGNHFTAGRYVVLLKQPSATRYAGGEPGYSATRVAPGQAFNARSSAVRSYASHLESSQSRVADRVGANAVRHYTVASNGFAAMLTGKQAFDLSHDKDVLLVTKDQARHLDTWNTPSFLGLSGPHGAWQRYAGGQDKAGDGIVVGDIDSGIWPEAKSFAGQRLTHKGKTTWDIRRIGKQRVRMEKASGGVFEGICQTGQKWNRHDCNTKLIAARYYPDAFESQVDKDHWSEHEVLSARDSDGHGTHTASTAAGNAGVRAKAEGVDFGTISGMAPAARIAAYKVCWEDDDPDTGGCYDSSILSAIDDAVADGVDVINFSISGATDTVLDDVEYAFEGAAEAGIFVAASAGNEGPGESTVAHNSPWLTTVAASTHHNFENTVVLGNHKLIKGASITKDALPQTKLVSSAEVALPGAKDADLCGPRSLDRAKVKGTIVLCLRGVYDRVAKSAEVKRAGGVGMILANPTPNSLDADFHSVPTIHIDSADLPTVMRYLKRAGKKATAAFKLGDVTGGKPTPLPQIAPFSSRGPALANDGDLLKPDISAPGVSVLAAVAPPTNSGRRFDLYSGTSMASPHIAGIAAFIKGVHPSWTPMKIKSAMMTTATALKKSNGKPLHDPFAQGAGQVRPGKLFDPGLFVLSDARDWRSFLQGQGADLGVRPLAAKDLNGPSLAQGQLTAKSRFVRDFTSTRKGTWKVSVHVKGFKATANKSHLRSHRVGDVMQLRMDFVRTTAPLGRFATGYLTLSGPTRVRLPIALRPVAVKAPRQVTGEGVTGSVSVPITPGFDGKLPVKVTGLAKAQTETGTLQPGVPDTDNDDALSCVDVAKGTKLARFALDAGDDAADMDLYVYAADADCEPTALAGQSATGSADESVDLVRPEPGKYVIDVDPYEAGPGKDSIDYRLDYFDVTAGSSAGDFKAEPNPVPVVNGVRTSFDAVWSDLAPDSRYLGMLEYDGALSPTFVLVNS